MRKEKIQQGSNNQQKMKDVITENADEGIEMIVAGNIESLGLTVNKYCVPEFSRGFMRKTGAPPILDRDESGGKRKGYLRVAAAGALFIALALHPAGTTEAANFEPAKIAPETKSYIYKQKKDTGWNVCRDLVKNLEKVRPSKASFNTEV